MSLYFLQQTNLSFTTDNPTIGGDMLLSEEQLLIFEQHINRKYGGSRNKRAIVNFDIYDGNKWQMPILYKIDSAFTSKICALI